MSGPRTTRSEILGASFAGFIIVFFCLLLLRHDPLVFWNDDYELSILPVFADVARSWSEGRLPLLSPYSWVCSNLAGEFQYGTFSVFVNAAVILIWKFPLTFPQQAAALSITHLFVLAAGAFLLARDRLHFHENVESPSPLATASSSVGEQSSPSGRGGRRSHLVRELTDRSFALSIFVALIAALNGWIICWGASDWFGALGALAWLPWAWWGLERALDPQRSRWRFLWPAPFVYLLVTGGFPYTVLMLAVLIAWLACRAVALREGGSIKTRWERRQRRESADPAWTRDAKALPTLLIWPLLGGAALGFGMSAPAWLAILDYVHGSARDMQTADAHWQWIVPWRALPGLILPCWTMNWADFLTRNVPHPGTELACGLVAPVALIAGLVTRGRTVVRRIKWDLFLLLLVLLLAMIPTAGVFRWSFRWLPFLHLVLALCAAETLRDSDPADQRTRGLVAVFVTGVTVVMMSIFNAGGLYAFPLTWILLGVTGIWTIGEFFSRNESLHAWLPAFATFTALLATYFCIPPNCGVPKYNLSQELLEPAPLDPQRLYLSIYPPAESTYRAEAKPQSVGQLVRPGSTAMWAGLHFVNGYSPILPAGIAREFDFRIHGEINPHEAEYLVWSQSNSNGLLCLLGIDGIVVSWDSGLDPALGPEWKFIASTDEGAVYHRIGPPLGRVRSVTSIDSRPNETFAGAKISQIDDSRNYVAADVDVPNGSTPALLTFSRPYFRGYEAKLGSQKLQVDSYRGLFPVIEVPAGGHGRLNLTYRPWWLVFGGSVAICCAGIFITSLVAAAVLSGRNHLNSLPPVTAAATN